MVTRSRTVADNTREKKIAGFLARMVSKADQTNVDCGTAEYVASLVEKALRADNPENALADLIAAAIWTASAVGNYELHRDLLAAFNAESGRHGAQYGRYH